MGRSFESVRVDLLKTLNGLVGCQNLELEVFGYAILLKNPITRDEIVNIIG